jgi:hypothetical protein
LSPEEIAERERRAAIDAKWREREFCSPVVALSFRENFGKRVPLMGFVVSHERYVVVSLVHIAFEVYGEVTLDLKPVLNSEVDCYFWLVRKHFSVVSPCQVDQDESGIAETVATFRMKFPKLLFAGPSALRLRSVKCLLPVLADCFCQTSPRYGTGPIS